MALNGFISVKVLWDFVSLYGAILKVALYKGLCFYRCLRAHIIDIEPKRSDGH